MATAVQAPPIVISLSDPRIKEKLQEFRHTDNFTNLYYLVRTYLFLAAVIGGTLWFYHLQRPGLELVVERPRHDRRHHPDRSRAASAHGSGSRSGPSHPLQESLLQRSRLRSCCACSRCTARRSIIACSTSPIISSSTIPTAIRIFRNCKTSGHWLHFPCRQEIFLTTLVKQLWLPNLFRYMRIRAALQRHSDRQESVSEKRLEAEQDHRARRHPVHARR